MESSFLRLISAQNHRIEKLEKKIEMIEKELKEFIKQDTKTELINTENNINHHFDD